MNLEIARDVVYGTLSLCYVVAAGFGFVKLGEDIKSSFEKMTKRAKTRRNI